MELPPTLAPYVESTPVRAARRSGFPLPLLRVPPPALLALLCCVPTGSASASDSPLPSFAADMSPPPSPSPLLHPLTSAACTVRPLLPPRLTWGASASWRSPGNTSSAVAKGALPATPWWPAALSLPHGALSMPLPTLARQLTTAAFQERFSSGRWSLQPAPTSSPLAPRPSIAAVVPRSADTLGGADASHVASGSAPVRLPPLGILVGSPPGSPQAPCPPTVSPSAASPGGPVA